MFASSDPCGFVQVHHEWCRCFRVPFQWNVEQPSSGVQRCVICRAQHLLFVWEYKCTRRSILMNAHVSSAEAVQCGLAPIPQFGKIIYNKHVGGNTTSYGTRGTYQCLPPFVLFGDAIAECTSNGKWTKKPECRGRMSRKPLLSNNRLKILMFTEHL